MGDSGGNNKSYNFFILFFVLAIIFCLVSAGVFKANTSISMVAYASKSEGSSGGDKSDGGGGSKDGGSSGGSDERGSSNDEGGGGSSGGSDNSGRSTGGDNNPTIEEPITPPPPPSICEQGSTSPECSSSTGPPPPPPPGPIDCSTTPNDPSCPTSPPCQSAVIGISCPPVDCTKTPDDPSCPPIHIDCPERVGFTLRAIENGKCVYDPIKCNQDEQLVNNKCSPSGPDESCLFHPEQDKCKPDQNGNCPNGFLLNDDNHCVPDKPCPKGFEHHAEDESGACYPIKKPPCQADGSQPNMNGKCPTSKTLSLDISIAKNPIVRGNPQRITVTVSDKDTHEKVSGANIKVTVGYVTGVQHKCSGSTDGSGHMVCQWQISGNAKPGKFLVNVETTKEGYASASKSVSFNVISAEPDHGGGSGNGHNHIVSPASAEQVKYFKEFTDMPPNSPIYITNTSMHKDALNDIVITGEIKNRGTNIANFVELIATFYNINNQTVGNENTFTKPSTLQPGQAAPFTMYLSPKDMPLGQIKSVKYHLSWKYAASSTSPSLTSP